MMTNLWLWITKLKWPNSERIREGGRQNRSDTKDNKRTCPGHFGDGEVTVTLYISTVKKCSNCAT